MTCLQCGKPLPRIARMRGNSEFCCREHREAYRLRQGLNRVMEADHVAQLTRRKEQPLPILVPPAMRPGNLEPRVSIPAPPAAARRPDECFVPPLRLAGDAGLASGGAYLPALARGQTAASPRVAGGTRTAASRPALPARRASLARTRMKAAAGFHRARSAAPTGRPRSYDQRLHRPAPLVTPRGLRLRRPALRPALESGAQQVRHAGPRQRRATQPVWFRSGVRQPLAAPGPELRRGKGVRGGSALPVAPALRGASAASRVHAFVAFAIARLPSRETRLRTANVTQRQAGPVGLTRAWAARAAKQSQPGRIPFRGHRPALRHPQLEAGAVASSREFQAIAPPPYALPSAVPVVCVADVRTVAVVPPTLRFAQRARMAARASNPPPPKPRAAKAAARCCAAPYSEPPATAARSAALRGGLATTLEGRVRELRLAAARMESVARSEQAGFRAPEVAFTPLAFATRGSLAGALDASPVAQEDFASGLSRWAGGVEDWKLDIAGARIGSLALFVPSLGLRDCELEFVARIENRTVAWALRAADFNNYYAVALALVPGGGELVRYAVMDGVPEPAVTARLPVAVRAKAALRVTCRVSGPEFTVAIEDQPVAAWSEPRLQAGGIGFLAAPDDRARLYRLRLSSGGQSPQRVQNTRVWSDRK